MIFFWMPGLFVETVFREGKGDNQTNDDDSDDDDDEDEWDDDYFEEAKLQRTQSSVEIKALFVRRLWNRLSKCALFFTVPKVKYILHNFCLLFYIAVVVQWLLDWPLDHAYFSPDFRRGYPHIEPALLYWKEVLWWMWTAARAFEEAVQIWEQGVFGYLSSAWNVLDAITDVSVIVAFILRIVAW